METVKDNAEVRKFFNDMQDSVDDITSSDPIEVIEALCLETPKLAELVKELCEY